MRVLALGLDGAQQKAGTYGSTSSTADNKDNRYFADEGILSVILPKGTVILFRQSAGQPIPTIPSVFDITDKEDWRPENTVQEKQGIRC